MAGFSLTLFFLFSVPLLVYDQKNKKLIQNHSKKTMNETKDVDYYEASSDLGTDSQEFHSDP